MNEYSEGSDGGEIGAKYDGSGLRDEGLRHGGESVALREDCEVILRGCCCVEPKLGLNANVS
jgi:hypothetical protein